MAKGNYVSKAAQNVNDFVNKEKESTPLPQTEAVEKTAERNGKKGRPVAGREIKVRKSFSVLPSLYEDAQKVAFVKRTNISELIEKMLKEYVEGNKEALSEYEKIK